MGFINLEGLDQDTQITEPVQRPRLPKIRYRRTAHPTVAITPPTPTSILSQGFSTDAEQEHGHHHCGGA